MQVARGADGKKPTIDLAELFADEVDLEYGHDDFVPSTEITPVSPEWYWRRRLVANDLNILAGTQGLGKSQAAIAIAAEATLREETVLVISAEDSPKHTIKPRFLAAGAKETTDDQGVPLIHIRRQDRPWTLDDAAKLQQYVYRLEASFVIIDPVSAFVEGATDTYKDAHVRKLLAPLRAIGEDQQCTILAIMHMKKGQESEAINTVGGSIAWTAAPRSVLILRRDADGDHAGDRILWHAKCNVGPEQAPLACTVKPELVGKHSNVETSRIEWGEERPELDIEAAFAPGITSAAPSKKDSAVAWLKEALTDGPVPSEELSERAEAEGICSPRTLRDAKKALRVEAKRGTTPDGKGAWFCSLP